MATLKFEDSASEYMLEIFGLSIDEQGFIVRNGERVVDFKGSVVKADNLGVISKVEDRDEFYLVQDDFMSLYDYVMIDEKMGVSVDDYTGSTYSVES